MLQSAYITSFIQQKFIRLQLSEYFYVNSRVEELRDINPFIRFVSPKLSTKSDVTVWSFSDASVNISVSESYFQIGIVSLLIFYANRGMNGHIFHLIDCNSSNKRRVSHSSYDYEILSFPKHMTAFSTPNS